MAEPLMQLVERLDENARNSLLAARAVSNENWLRISQALRLAVEWLEARNAKPYFDIAESDAYWGFRRAVEGGET